MVSKNYHYSESYEKKKDYFTNNTPTHTTTRNCFAFHIRRNIRIMTVAIDDGRCAVAGTLWREVARIQLPLALVRLFVVKVTIEEKDNDDDDSDDDDSDDDSDDHDHD